MADLKDIKKKIYEEDKIGDILEAIGCEHVRQEGVMRYIAQLPDRFHSNNKRSVQVKMENHLSSSIRTLGFSGDIYNLVSYIFHDKRGQEIQDDLHNAKKFICETLGWNQFLKGEKGYTPKVDHVAPLKAILKGKKQRREIKPNPVIPESILEEYYPFGKPLPYKSWIEEGISYSTQMLYGIGFDMESKRVVMPMRNRFGKLVGVKGRIMKDEDDDRKYLYLHRFQNRYEWFNFHYAHPYILIDKKVYIFEAEKSCMKSYSNGIFNTLAIGASEISEEQVQIVKQLGLDIEIVLCYDKGIKIGDIIEGMKMFQGRTVSAIYDTDNILENKNSPIDQGVDVFNRLLEGYTFDEESLKKLQDNR